MVNIRTTITRKLLLQCNTTPASQATFLSSCGYSPGPVQPSVRLDSLQDTNTPPWPMTCNLVTIIGRCANMQIVSEGRWRNNRSPNVRAPVGEIAASSGHIDVTFALSASMACQMERLCENVDEVHGTSWRMQLADSTAAHSAGNDWRGRTSSKQIPMYDNVLSAARTC